MFDEARKRGYEFVRCTRHNLLHLKVFRLAYRHRQWHVRDGDLEMVFPYYPYLSFRDLEGYLNDGRWRPEPGMTVLDVGGCFGEYALYASRRVGESGRVVMLEPDPANIKVARDLFALNGNPRNIEIIPAGLWNEKGVVRFNAGQSEQSSVALDEPAGGAGAAMIEIPTESLASVVSRCGLDRLDIVKMDIEGAELEVMAAAGELPPRFKPRYAIASYHIRDGRRTADVLPETFARLGYHSKVGFPNHLTTYASPGELD
jgi:FkbM family methyltransferase